MFECGYCGNVFEQLTTIGACPACGGPKPKRLQPEVQTVIVREYVHINETPRHSSYYAPPRPSFKQQAYNTLGYRLTTAIFILLVVILAISFVYWLNYRVSPPATSDPSYQLKLPTALPTATSVVENNPWKDEAWLTSVEAISLRTQENVLNLAYLEKGGVLYSKEHSFAFNDATWVESKPLGLTELTLTGTAVQLKAGGYSYTLNVLQPFVQASQPNMVVVVDAQGSVWQADFSSLTITSVNNVVSGLTIQIFPNPNLSTTY